MTSVVGKNTKRKHLSKNKKKSWKKVDITDVEEFLEDERLQERTGGKVAEKKNETLFFVDKSSVKTVSKDRNQRKRDAHEKLKEIEEALKPPPPKKKDKRAQAVIQKEASGILSMRKTVALKQRKKALVDRRIRVRTRVKLPVANYDLWGDKIEPENADVDDHFLRVTRKKIIKVPDHMRQLPSLVPAVEVPHPGASYNPAYDDYQNLLFKAHGQEERKMLEEAKIRRALDDKFPSEAPTEASMLAELSAQLFGDDEEEDGERDLEEDKGLSVNAPVRRDNKKDEKRRRKEKALKEMAKQLQQEKQRRFKENDVFRLRGIKAEIKTRDAELTKRSQKRAIIRTQDLYRTKRLGRIKYEEPELELKLSDDLVGSLREIKPEGHLLLDRYNSLVKRNILEPRGAAGKKQKRKYKPKVFEKKSHKDVKYAQ